MTTKTKKKTETPTTETAPNTVHRVHRVHPSFVVPGMKIAEGENQSQYNNGDISRKQSTVSRIEQFDSYNQSICRHRNYHIHVHGSSIPQCWDRGSTVPVAIPVEQ